MTLPAAALSARAAAGSTSPTLCGEVPAAHAVECVWVPAAVSHGSRQVTARPLHCVRAQPLMCN